MKCSARMIVLAVLALVGVAIVGAEERFALVIGNSNYETIPALRNPQNDAVDIAHTLRELGYSVQELLDADLRQMRESVRTLGAQLQATPSASSVFYYAGHGVQSGGENFLVPVRADIRTENDLPYEALSVNYVLDYLNDAGGSFNMIILDACRDNPFATFRSSGRGLAVVQAPRGSIVLYATGAGQVAEDGDGRNGTFTAAFLQHVRTPDIAVSELVRRVGQEVGSVTQQRQVPAFYSNYFGEYRFVPGDFDGTAVAQARPAPAPAPSPQPVAVAPTAPAAPPAAAGQPAEAQPAALQTDAVQSARSFIEVPQVFAKRMNVVAPTSGSGAVFTDFHYENRVYAGRYFLSGDAGKMGITRLLDDVVADNPDLPSSVIQVRNDHHRANRTGFRGMYTALGSMVVGATVMAVEMSSTQDVESSGPSATPVLGATIFLGGSLTGLIIEIAGVIKRNNSFMRFLEEYTLWVQGE